MPKNKLEIPITSVFNDIKDNVKGVLSNAGDKIVSVNKTVEEQAYATQFEAFGKSGAEFRPAVGDPTTADKVSDFVREIARADIAPVSISPLECRLGGSRFFIPPVSMKVSQSFAAGALSGGALRQQSSPKFNSGHSETLIEMDIYFPNADTIWGFEGDSLNLDFDKADDATVDQFMSSLRGLIAQFKYAPFLPVKNAFLNGTYGITGVVLKDLAIGTVEGFPFCMAAKLTMYKFNHNVYLPMVDHFEDAVHWGKYRQYIGRAAKRLQEQADKEFLTKKSPEKVKGGVTPADPAGLVRFSKTKDFQEGKDFDLFVPNHTPARQLLPDMEAYRDPSINPEGHQKAKNWWQGLIGLVGLDVNTNPDAKFENVNRYPGEKTFSNEDRLLKAWVNRVGVTLTQMGSGSLKEFLQHLERSELRAGASQAEVDELKIRGRAAWFAYMYTSLIEDPQIQNFLAYQEYVRGDVIINEWEVPMTKVGLNPKNVFVQQVSVQMGNNIVRLQVQLQDEPVHQHIGGLDTTIMIGLVIFGEEDLLRLRTMFDHLQGMARLEHGHAVLGFLGIKNVITALCGTKYVIPDRYEVETVPGFPHVYEVQMSFIDFDIFQQKRESLSHEQQAELIEAFTKRNPFLRIKQHWGAFSAYPDFPLSVRDDDGRIVGHLDPDWYYKSFDTVDEDIVAWRNDQEAGVGYDNKITHHFSKMSKDGKMQSVELHGGGMNIKDGTEYIAKNLSYNEPHAGNIQTTPDAPGLVPPSNYMQPYVDGSGDPSATFDKMMEDSRYRNKYGRMVRAFPTYMLWLIDEGGVFAGIKLFDNFYGLQSVIDFSIVRSEEIMADTLVLRLSNLTKRLSTNYRDLVDEDIHSKAKIINTQINRSRNLVSGLTDHVVQLETIQLKPGVRVHLRMGYSANPNALETVFNGTIAEVETGDIITVVAQSDAVELGAVVNSANKEGHSGKLDGSLMSGFWMSEPRDLMVRLLSMGTSAFREQIAHATRRSVFSENRFGIRHFGHILYEPMSQVEENLHDKRKQRLEGQVAGFTGGGPLKMLGSVFSFFDTGVFDIVNSLWVNFNRARDYELFKRNIYPGNGLGVSQYLGGDIGDGGLATAMMGTGVSPDGTQTPQSVTGEILPDPDPRQVLGAARQAVDKAKKEAEEKGGGFVSAMKNSVGGPLQGHPRHGGHPMLQALGMASKGDDDANGLDEVSFRAQTYMKSVWDLFQVCAALLPNYIVAVRPFEDRSTVFYGKPHWMYTSGVIPLTYGIKPEHGPATINPNQEVLDFVKNAEDLVAKRETPEALYNRMSAMVPEINGSDPTSTTQGVQWNGGDISSLPLTHTSGAVIPQRSGTTSIEMHLPTDTNLDKDKSQHKKDYPLPANLQHPYYMDRKGGPRGGYISTNKKERPGASDTILPGESPLEGGKSGAFGMLDPISEQWYMNMRWPEGTRGKNYKNLRGRRVLMYNDRTKKAVIGTPGEYGPHGKTGRIGGMSPECWVAIGAQTSDTIWFGFVDDSTPLGPVVFKSGAEFKGVGFPAAGAVTLTNPKATTGTAPEPPSSGGQYMPTWLKKRAHKEVTDPRDYSLKFGHVEPNVPVNYSEPDHGLVDVAGSAAAEVYAKGGERSKEQANEIWDEFRMAFKNEDLTKQIFLKNYPKQAGLYPEIMTMFLKFMWQHPYHRGWVVYTADRQMSLTSAVGLNASGDAIHNVLDDLSNPLSTTKKFIKNPLDTIGGWAGAGKSGEEKHWNFNRAHELFENYIVRGNDASVEWMRSHAQPGRDNDNIFTRTYEEFHRRVVDSVFKILGNVAKAVGGAFSGILSLLRLSMLTFTQGLSLGGHMQRQANALNRSFNDSIYFNAGPPGSLLYLADNPFTREYGEPVAEIREPFQRVHFLSSFSHILKNGIVENLTDVATVITATSNGGKPITVHFDKGASAEKQVERSVETGLAWDKPKGIVDAITNPTKIIRTITKTFANGNDETSAKRVALWHLKESLKNIYGGEILVLGDPSIRPHDLVYLGDAYEKMYGMVEVEQVIHHFTPEGGFVTSITPNAIVTINDPYRWTLGSVMRGKWANWNLRHDLRHVLGNRPSDTLGPFLRKGPLQPISAWDQPALPGGMTQKDMSKALARGLDDQIKGTVQYTGGMGAIIKDIASATAVGGIGTGLAAGAAADLGLFGAAAGLGTTGLLVGGGLWKAWDYVKDNLLDQHGCYISYLTHDGQPMDAGLSDNHGVAVGQQHVVTLFKNSFNVKLSVNDQDTGQSTIALNDLLGQMGWKPQETSELIRDNNIFVQETRNNIMKAAGRHFAVSSEIPYTPPLVDYVQVTAVINGHTIEVSGGPYKIIRLANIVAPPFSGRAIIKASDPGALSKEYAESRLLNKFVALRSNRTDPSNKFGEGLAWVFSNGVSDKDPNRKKFLVEAASKVPLVEWDSYLASGTPYTYNWESVIAGVASVDINKITRSIPGEGVLRGSP